MVSARLVVFPTSWRVADRRFLEPAGRPGPAVVGFGAPAGRAVFARRFRNPRRTRAGVSRPSRAGRSHGRRKSWARCRARRSCVWAAITIHVHRSAEYGSRSLGAVQPRVCLKTGRCVQGRICVRTFATAGPRAMVRRRPAMTTTTPVSDHRRPVDDIDWRARLPLVSSTSVGGTRPVVLRRLDNHRI